MGGQGGAAGVAGLFDGFVFHAEDGYALAGGAGARDARARGSDAGAVAGSAVDAPRRCAADPPTVQWAFGPCAAREASAMRVHLHPGPCHAARNACDG